MEPYLNEDEQKYARAKKRVQEIKGFYGNLTSYVVVNIFLLILNLITSAEHLWFYWPLLGWGIGVVFHGMKVFNYSPILGHDWEERKIRELIEKEENNRKKYQ